MVSRQEASGISGLALVPSARVIFSNNSSLVGGVATFCSAMGNGKTGGTHRVLRGSVSELGGNIDLDSTSGCLPLTCRRGTAVLDCTSSLLLVIYRDTKIGRGTGATVGLRGRSVGCLLRSNRLYHKLSRFAVAFPRLAHRCRGGSAIFLSSFTHNSFSMPMHSLMAFATSALPM